MGSRATSTSGLDMSSLLRAAKGALLVALPATAAAQEAVCHDQWAAWAPDGRSVVFVSTVTGDHEVYTASLETGDVLQLTDIPGRDAHPSFSPDGLRIAFQSPRDGEGTHLYVIDRDGSNARRVTSMPGFAGMPVWSPDGEELAFQHRPERDQLWQLQVVRLADGSVRTLSDGKANDQVVNWSPDGERLTFHSDRSGMYQVYVWQDGATQQITHGPYEHRNAAWSPDGETLALRSTLEGGPWLYLLPLVGQPRPVRVGTVQAEHGVPFFSPDGSRLLVTPDTPDGTRISVVAIETGRVRAVPGACPVR